jgi:patatin-like phospholipase/acyl hydrolase
MYEVCRSPPPNRALELEQRRRQVEETYHQIEIEEHPRVVLVNEADYESGAYYDNLVSTTASFGAALGADPGEDLTDDDDTAYEEPVVVDAFEGDGGDLERALLRLPITAESATSPCMAKFQEDLESVHSDFSNTVEKDLVILIGCTGEGKSTVAQWLCREPLVAFPDPENPRNFLIQSAPGVSHGQLLTDSGNAIGHGTVSKTTQPHPWVCQEENIVFADCPGLNDTRGILQEMKNALTMRQLFASSRQVRFLIVIEVALVEAQRGIAIAERMRALINMVPNVQPGNIAMVVTKHNEFSMPLESIRNRIKDIATNQRNAQLKELLLSLEGKTEVFRSPTGMGDISGETDRSKVIASIHRVIPVHLSLADVNIPFSPISQIFLRKIETILDGILKILLDALKGQFERHSPGHTKLRPTVDKIVKEGMDQYASFVVKWRTRIDTATTAVRRASDATFLTLNAVHRVADEALVRLGSTGRIGAALALAVTAVIDATVSVTSMASTTAPAASSTAATAATTTGAGVVGGIVLIGAGVTLATDYFYTDYVARPAHEQRVREKALRLKGEQLRTQFSLLARTIFLPTASSSAANVSFEDILFIDTNVRDGLRNVATCLDFVRRLLYPQSQSRSWFQQIWHSTFDDLFNLTRSASKMSDSDLYADKMPTRLPRSHFKNLPVTSSSMPFRVGLSIDGGGTRGLIPALYLQEIEDLSGKPVSELVDVIGGTSVGGILSLGLVAPDSSLTKPRYTARDFVDLFRTKSSVIFGTRALSIIQRFTSTVLNLTWEPGYSSEPLERLLSEKFKDIDLSAAIRPLVIPAMQPDEQVFWFKSHNIDVEETRHNFKMNDVGRSTSAAPTYFPDAKVKCLCCEEHAELTFLDGGVVCNNPAEEVHREMKVLYPGARNLAVVSFGTGAADPKSLPRDMGTIQAARTLIPVLMNRQAALADAQMRENLGAYYMRVQCVIAADVELDNSNPEVLQLLERQSYKQMHHIEEITRWLLLNHEYWNGHHSQRR